VRIFPNTFLKGIVMKISRLFAAALISGLALSASANAATYTITLGATNTYALTGAVTGNIDLGSTASPVSMLTLAGDAEIVPAGYSVAELTAAPTGPMYADKYLYVTGNTGSLATFSLVQHNSNFGFTWGTIDTYNTLVLSALLPDNTVKTYKITGADLLSNISDLTGGTSQLDVVFKLASGTFTKAVLTSSQNSFEVGNFSSVVPLPAALPLFVSGIAALAGFAKRRKA